MRAGLKTAAAASLLITCMLTGCVSGGPASGASNTSNTTKADNTDAANKNADQAILLVEDYLKENDPSAELSKTSFTAIEAELRKGSSDKILTDWVSGEYSGAEKVSVLVNVTSGEIFTSKEWNKVETYCIELADTLYGTDNGDTKIAVTGTVKRPYIGDADATGAMMDITNMLPAGVTADGGYIRSLLDSGEYEFMYVIRISEDADISIFKDTDRSTLGSNARIHVEQYSKTDFDSLASSDGIMPEPLEIYDSGVPGN